MAEERKAFYTRSGWWGRGDLLARYLRVVSEFPDRPILKDNRGRQYSNATFWAAAEGMCADFRARGIGAGDIVLIVLPNWVEWQIAHLAIRQLGAVPANIPIRTDAGMLAHVVKLVSVRCIIGADRFDGFQAGAILDQVAADAAHRIDILKIDLDGGQHWYSNDAIADAIPSGDTRLDHIMFTSSTTGMPKAVMHSQDDLNAFHETVLSRFPIGDDGAIFMGSPLGHSVGAIHGARMSLYFGLPMVLQQRWDAAEAVQMIEDNNCTFTVAATPFLKDLVGLDHPGALPKLNSLKYFLCGGAQVPPALMQQADAAFPNTYVTVLWGMTEGGYVTCIPDVTPRQERYFTAGCASDGLEVVVTDPNGNLAPPDVEGDLRVRGPAVFYGYYNQPDLTATLFDESGFFFVGDRAIKDANGYIRITGRSKDLIIRGGVNISPVPIEDVLAAHPDVSSVAVIGYPDDRLGERICAVFGPAKRRLSFEETIEYSHRNGLAKQHWPERVFYIDEMPTTPAGKIRKNDVRQWLEAQIAANGGDA